MWQELRKELHHRGFEVVTVALDTGGAAAAGPWIDAAKPAHPSLIDAGHLLDELFGVVNVPTGIWIDEQGVLVRPPEPAWPGRVVLSDMLRNAPTPAPGQGDPYVADMLAEARKIRHDADRYATALRDWVANGSASRYALTPGEVVARSRPRPSEEALAAAHFELGQHLHRAGHGEDAVPHFREAHRLHPANWTYKRQAWSFVDVWQKPSDVYEGDWVGDVRAIGAENYYPALDL